MSFLRTLRIDGYRGFARAQELEVAVPEGQPGSGLTTIVGANNTGKSTIIESLRIIGTPQAQSFSQGKRNLAAGDRVSLSATMDDGSVHELSTVPAGGSETEWIRRPEEAEPPRMYVLPSRRYFNPYFGRTIQEREQYIRTGAGSPDRGMPSQTFHYRLFTAHQNRERFDEVLARVLTPLPDWVIDQADNGQYFLKFVTHEGYHTSEGLGEGLVSLFFIVDALYDSAEGDIIVIDEPELSLHPSLQRRLMNLLIEYAATRQMVLSTHSPYFVDFATIAAGARIARVSQANGSAHISSLTADTSARLSRFLNNRHNPHILGVDAREVFFLDDGVVLMEGQEDVIYYDIATDAIAVPLAGAKYGWGVGGADNMALVARMLRELGFVRVVGILDGDRPDEAEALREEFPEYHFEVLPADDVRTKAEQPPRDAVMGLLDEGHGIRPEFRESFEELVIRVNEYLDDRHGA